VEIVRIEKCVPPSFSQSESARSQAAAPST
jgi:hypothetical protein